MKRGAILISGIVRDYGNMQNIYDNIINVNKEYEFDIFLSMYDINCNNTLLFYKNNDVTTLLKTDINDVLSTYNPKSYKVINFIELNNKIKELLEYFIQNNLGNSNWDKNGNRNAYNTLSQLYSVEMVNTLFSEYSYKHNINYDLVIRYRYDLFTNEPIIFNNYDLKNIYGISRANCYPDWLFFGNSFNMNLFMNIYSNLIDKKINPDISEMMFKENCNNVCSLLYTIKDTFEIIHVNHM